MSLLVGGKLCEGTPDRRLHLANEREERDTVVVLAAVRDLHMPPEPT